MPWLDVGDGRRVTQCRMPRASAVLALVIVSALAIVVTGCSSGRPGRHGQATVRRASTAAPTHPSPTTASHMADRLAGKFTASPIVFANARLGLVTIGGFVGADTAVSSWQDRTTDGGRTWAAGPVAHSGAGRYPSQVATTQIGLAFVSGDAGWAYQPSLFYTLDGGLTWVPEPGRPAGVGPVAVQGSSAWVVGYPCRSLNCRPQIFQTGRVGGALTRLPTQPPGGSDISTLLRPTQRTAWVMTEDRRGHQQLITTTDAGHSWQREATPCNPGDTMSISGDRPTGLVLMCVSRSQNMCDSCGAHVLYRSSDDGADWIRLTPTPTPPYSRTTPTQFIQPLGASTVWAVNETPVGTGTVLRSVDQGRRWTPVLTGTTARPLGIEAFVATDARHAWLVTMTNSTANGIGFTVYRTSNGGRSWKNSTLPIPAHLH